MNLNIFEQGEQKGIPSTVFIRKVKDLKLLKARQAETTVSEQRLCDLPIGITPT